MDANSTLSDIPCPGCGSSFNLVDDSPTASFDTVQRSIGQFELVQALGAGTFGIVWMARDSKLDRTVAVKVPRKGQLDQDNAEKFFREARAAAQLKHPNIVTVHEVGKSDDSIYIVTEYIQGVSLAEWLTARRPSFREAAELCAVIARALHFAHERGVIHRDLKPGNIMLDADIQPHVMDFGLAKRDAGEMTMTLDGHVIGTPAYMSPEQAAGRAHDADRRTDIYSLGVILYELLTGEVPFRGAIRMLIFQVLHEDPPRPRKLNHRIPRDLETICLKCLQKSPERRYRNAQELADDLQRWLDRRPIAARPVGPFQRSWRWCQRRPAVALLLGLLFVVAATGFSAVTWQWRRAVAGESAARENARQTSEQKQKAEFHAAEVERERERAEANFRRVQEAVEQMLVRVGDERLKNVPHMSTLRQELLEEAIRFYQDLLDQKSDDLSVQLQVARTHMRLGGLYLQLGRFEPSMTSFDRGIEMLERLHAEHGDNHVIVDLLASSLHNSYMVLERTRQFDEGKRRIRRAISLYRSLLDTHSHPVLHVQIGNSLNALGSLLQTEGSFDDALEAYADARKVREFLVAQFPDDWEHRFRLAGLHYNLGNVYLAMESFADAEREYGSALKTAQELAGEESTMELREFLCEIHGQLGNLYQYTQRYQDGEKAFLAVAQTMTELAKDFPGIPDYQFRLASALYNLGNLRNETRQLATAEEAYRQSSDISEKLIERFPTRLDCLEVRRGALIGLGNICQYTERFAQAEDYFREAIEVSESILAKSPGNAESRYAICTTHFNLGNLYYSRGQLVDAERTYLEALPGLRQKWTIPPLESRRKAALAGTLTGLGNIAQEQDSVEQADRYFSEALELAREQVGQQPHSPDALHSIAVLHFNLGNLYEKMKRYADSKAQREEALRWADRLAKAFPVQVATELLSDCHNGMAMLLADCPDESLRDPSAAVQHAKQAVELSPDSGTKWNTLGIARYRNGDDDSAAAAFQNSMRLSGGGDSHDFFFLAMIHARNDRPEEAQKLFQKARDWMDANGPNDDYLLRYRQEAEQLLMKE